MVAGCLFDFAFEFLEVCEHFTLLPHEKNPCVPGEVVDEGIYLITNYVFCILLEREQWIGFSPTSSEICKEILNYIIDICLYVINEASEPYSSLVVKCEANCYNFRSF